MGFGTWERRPWPGCWATHADHDETLVIGLNVGAGIGEYQSIQVKQLLRQEMHEFGLFCTTTAFFAQGRY
jgi:hypothetical protein